VIRDGSGRRVVTLGLIGGLLALSFLWTSVATHTEAGVTSTFDALVATLRGQQDNSRSSDTSYALFAGAGADPAKAMQAYETSVLDTTEQQRLQGAYYSGGPARDGQGLLAQYPTPVAPQSTLPLTATGRFLARLGIDVARVNNDVRAGSARLLQLLMALGLVAVAFGGRRILRVPSEILFIAAGMVVVLVLQVVLPVLSVNYGILREFEQSLVLLGLFIAIGSMALLPPRFSRGQAGLAGLLVVAFFVSSTGIVTQSLGCYGAQRHLDNSGGYYDDYYVHPEEVAALSWLGQHRPGGLGPSPTSVIETDRNTLSQSQSIAPVTATANMLPLLVRRDAYVFVGYPTVTEGDATARTNVGSVVVTYRYPMPFLDDHKDLLYSSQGARVYR
jgi:hypothetical protein